MPQCTRYQVYPKGEKVAWAQSKARESVTKADMRCERLSQTLVEPQLEVQHCFSLLVARILREPCKE